MKIAFRVDASMQIGTGHVMRCVTLADALLDRDIKVHFICRYLPSSLEKMLRDKGFHVSILPASQESNGEFPLAHSDWLGVPQEVDARAALALIQNQGYDWLIVDHYALDVRWEKILRSEVKKVMVIDDLADREHDCDILLDQNLYADQEIRYKDKVSSQCRTLIGPRYALLRKEFSEFRNKVEPRQGRVTRILVFFGGVDAKNFTSKAILGLSQITEHKFFVDVVIGDQHPNKNGIEILCQRLGYICHVQTNKMAELMANADFSIGAGGSASWERCCLGLPSLLVALAENQVDIANALDSICACVYIGLADKVNFLAIKDKVTDLLNSQDQLAMITKQSFSLVDGQGVSRVCHELGK